MVKVKICGTTNLGDALKAAELGADYIGFIFYPKSPRYITPDQACQIMTKLPDSVEPVGVFVNQDLAEINAIAVQCDLTLVQLSGNESPDFCQKISLPVIKAFHIKNSESLVRISDYDTFAYLLDSHKEGFYGGTGQAFDLSLLEGQHFNKPIFLSGGLTLDNVEEAISKVNPFAVDVCSGAEQSPGKKDYQKLQAFIKAAKALPN